jgi:hypothetical protein
VKRLNKEKIAGIVALILVLISLLGVQQGYARGRGPLGRPVTAWVLVGSVSNPSGGCLNLGLNGVYGTVSILPSKSIQIFLQHANPNSALTVSVGYVQTNGGCDGTWQSVSSLNTNSTGFGTLAQSLSLPSGHTYIFEFEDSAGNIVYATDFLSL